MTETEYYNGYKISYAHGYQEIYLPSHPRARAGGNVYVHDVAAEQIIGRCLLPNEVVHHKDGNKCNNDITNLMVFDSTTSHTIYHHLLKSNFKGDFVLYKISNVYHCDTNMSLVLERNAYKAMVLTDKGTASKVRLTAMKVCPTCGKLITKKAQMCRECYIMTRRKINIPSKQQLKRDLREFGSFVGVGKKYGVTDNAIRKWCAKRGIPTKSSVIRTLTPSDWKKL